MSKLIFMSFLTPQYYQGRTYYKNYFEGWYFKLRNEDFCLAVIAGISLNRRNPHAFIQTLDSEGVSDYIRYPLSDFFAFRKKLFIRIGNNTFSDSVIRLDIRGKRNISGVIRLENVIHYPRRLLSPNIMGPFGYFPRLECNHAVVHIKSELSGNLKIEDKEVSFDGGVGYCEKDYGTTFPAKYFWIHADNFGKDVSLMAAVADVPVLKMLNKSIKGIISFIRIGAKLYNISTYNGARLVSGNIPESLTIKNRVFTLNISTTTVRNSNAGQLIAPAANAAMTEEISETLCGEVSVELYKRNKLVFSGKSTMAGVEYKG